MELIKTWGEEHLYHCNTCGKDFIMPYISPFRYGECLYLTEDGSICVYINHFEDPVSDEFSKLVDPFFLSKKHNELGDVFRDVFGISIDKVKGKKVDASRGLSTCYYCASESIKCINEDMNSKEILCPVVTHNQWNKLDTKAKKELIEKELKRKNLL